MADEQSWHNCEYACPSDGGDEFAHDLRMRGLSESYNCESPGIKSLGVFKAKEIQEKDSSITKVAVLYQIGFAQSNLNDKNLEKIVESNLTGCRFCKFYEKKDKPLP